MPKWVINVTLPEIGGDADETAITQTRLTEEVQELCRAGFDLDDDEFTVEVAQAPTAEAEQAERTGTEG